jgi:hypothetical protein
VDKHVRLAICSRQAHAASVTAADPQVAERHGGDCEDVKSLPDPPTSDDQSILPNREWILCFPARRILWRALHASWAYCWRTKKAVLRRAAMVRRYMRSAKKRFGVGTLVQGPSIGLDFNLSSQVEIIENNLNRMVLI